MSPGPHSLAISDELVRRCRDAGWSGAQISFLCHVEFVFAGSGEVRMAVKDLAQRFGVGERTAARVLQQACELGLWEKRGKGPIQFALSRSLRAGETCLTGTNGEAEDCGEPVENPAKPAQQAGMGKPASQAKTAPQAGMGGETCPTGSPNLPHRQTEVVLSGSTTTRARGGEGGDPPSRPGLFEPPSVTQTSGADELAAAVLEIEKLLGRPVSSNLAPALGDYRRMRAEQGMTTWRAASWVRHFKETCGGDERAFVRALIHSTEGGYKQLYLPPNAKPRTRNGKSRPVAQGGREPLPEPKPVRVREI